MLALAHPETEGQYRHGDPTMQDQDVIQAARGIRSNPALFAALMSPPTAAPASADPTAGLTTRNDPGGRFGEPARGSQQSAPRSAWGGTNGRPAINAGRTAAQTADRMAQAKALTGSPPPRAPQQPGLPPSSPIRPATGHSNLGSTQNRLLARLGYPDRPRPLLGLLWGSALFL